MVTPTRWDPALEPVRHELLADAHRDADHAAEDASREAAEAARQAAAEVHDVLEEARARGASAGELARAGERRRTRAKARATVLAAQRAAYLELRQHVLDRLAALREDPSYPSMRERLVGRATALLGPNAVVRDAPQGGVVVTDGGRTVDLSFPVLADEVMAAMGTQLEGLWTP